MRAWGVALVLLGVSTARGATGQDQNLIAIGQGISSPSSTSMINYASGFASENPLGVIYQDGRRLTAHYAQNGHATTGGELGYGNRDWGLAAGYRTDDCEGCKASMAAAAGVNIMGVGIGARFVEDLYAVGLLFNPQGKHRLGVVAEMDQRGGETSKVTVMGAGYSYVGSQVTFSVDASTRQFDDPTVKDERVLVTPGLKLRADGFEISVNDRITLNDTTSGNDKDQIDHHAWFGIGVGGSAWHLAFYVDYVSEVAVAGSLFF